MEDYANQSSQAEDAARAWWLVDIPLLDERAEEADIRAAIRLRLQAMEGIDEAIGRRVVERCFGKDGDRLSAKQKWPQSLAESAFRGPGLLENTQTLCNDLFQLTHGLPQFKPDLRLHRLARVIDPDGLVCLDERVRLPVDERFNWPAIPIGDGGNASCLLVAGSVDTHIHLGGALPPLFYWVAIMGGEIPLDALSFFPTDATRSTKGKGLWQRAIGQAMALRLCLAARVQRYFHRVNGERVFEHLPEPPAHQSDCLPWFRRLFAPTMRCRLAQPATFHAKKLKRAVYRLPRPSLRYVAEQPWFGLEQKLRTACERVSLEQREPYRTGLAFAEIRGVALGLSHQQRFTIAPEDRWALTDPLRMEHSQAFGGCHYAEGERRLLVHAARMLRETHDFGERAALEASLLAYLRIRNAFHRKLVHDHGSEGLMSFIESFNRRGFYFGQRKSVARLKEAAKKPDASVRERLLLRRNKRRRAGRLLEGSRMKAALDMQLVEAFDPPPEPPMPVFYRDQAKGFSSSWDSTSLAPPVGRDNRAREDFLTTLPGPLRRIEMRVSLPKGNQAMRILRVWLEAVARHLHTDKGIRNHQVGLVFHLLKKSGSGRCARDAERQAAVLCHVLHDYPGLRRYIIGLDAAGEERQAPPRVFANAFKHMRHCEDRLRPHPRHPFVRLGWTYHAGEDADDMLTALRHIDEVVRLLLPDDRPARLGHALLLGEKPEQFYARRRGEVDVVLGAHLLDLVWAQGVLGQDHHPEYVLDLHRRIYDLVGKEVHIDECCKAMQAGREHAAAVKSDDELLAILRVNPQEMGGSRTLFADPGWIKMVGLLQQALRESLTRRRIAIEANPTSNLIIGGYSQYSDLPYRILVESGLPLSLNTDDPGLFMSSLPGEFASMYKALATDMRHREALAWLRERLFDAEESSFLENVPVGAENPILTNIGRNWVFRFDP